MILSKIYKNTLLILAACLVLTACATKKEVATTDAIQGQMQGDVYTGTDTVEYLADGVPDRVFFATNETILTTAKDDPQAQKKFTKIMQAQANKMQMLINDLLLLNN